MDRHVLMGFGIGAAVVGGLCLLKSSFESKTNRSANGRKSQDWLSSSSRKREGRLKLYHSFPFRSSRCAWVINELGIEEFVEVIPISLHGPDSKDLFKYKKEVHPHGTIPALELEDGRVMFESSAICLYLANEFSGVNGRPELVPNNDRIADYYDKTCYAVCTFDQVLEPLYMQLTHTPEDQRDHRLVDSKLKDFEIIATVLSKHFEKSTYVCGDQFTTADCVLGYNVWWASVIKKGELLKDYPNLVSYLQRIKERPAFVKAFVGKRPIKPSGGSL